MAQPILTIAIPTYNRADILSGSLKCVIDAAEYAYKKGIELNSIEIIVSNNNSTDHTIDVLNRINHPYFTYYSNSENLGFLRNCFLLTDQYACGEFCWMIGDDDYIDIDSIFIVINQIKQHNVDYIAVMHRVVSSKDELLLEHTCRANKSKESYFADVIDSNNSHGNTLSCFISGSIFRLKPIRDYKKNMFIANDWSKFYNVFPNGYLMVSNFVDKKCLLIQDKLLSVLPITKEWEDKDELIITTHLPDMYNYYISLGVNPDLLKNTHRKILSRQITLSISKLHRMRKVSKQSIFQMIKSPIITTTCLCNLIYSKLRLTH